MECLDTMADRIKAAVGGKELTINELLDMVNSQCGEKSISKGTISTALSYKTKIYNFTAKNLMALAKTLNVSVDYLLGLSNTKETSEYSSLGLSEESVDVLKDLMDSVKSHTNRQNTLKISNAKKKLDVINWILEHEANSNDNFLLSLYNYIMCGFDSYKGTTMDIFVEEANRNIDKELDEYINCVREYQMYSADDYVDSVLAPSNKDNLLKKLAESRCNYIRYQSFNQDLSEDLELYNDTRCVFVSDPQTYDELALTLPSPQKLIQITIEDILEKWHKEYDEVYQKRVKQIKERTKIKDSDFSSYEDYLASLEDSEDDEFILDEEIMYRPRDTYDFSEEEMCKYLLCEFLEKTPLQISRIRSDNELIFFKHNLSEDEINRILHISQESGIGLVRKNDKFFFDLNATIPSKQRLKERFERDILPSYYKKWFEQPFFAYIIDSHFIQDISDEEYKEIMNKAAELKLQYQVTRNHCIEIFNDEYLKRVEKSDERLLEMIKGI